MRIRTIKPEFWTNEHIARLPDFTILLAIGLLNYSDDEGYFNANPALIRAALFPLRECSGSIPVAVTELSNQGFLELFEATDGRTYGRVVNFKKHQVINKPYPSKIKELCVTPVGLLHLSGSDTVVLPSGTGIREQGKDQGILPSSAAPKEEVATEGPEHEIYSHYPRKVGKAAALKAIRNALKKAEKVFLVERTKLFAEAVAKWSPGDLQFVPHPSTWFNEGRFDDDPSTWERVATQTDKKVAGWL